MTTMTKNHTPAAPLSTDWKPKAPTFGTETDARRHPAEIEYRVSQLRLKLADATDAWEFYSLYRATDAHRAIESKEIAERSELAAGEILAELRATMGTAGFAYWCSQIRIDGFCHTKATALIERFISSLNHKVAEITKEAKGCVIEKGTWNRRNSGNDKEAA